jgi:Histidine kinase/Histidine kinase-, DNA gyrase B-, and HSP90-like ATPase
MSATPTSHSASAIWHARWQRFSAAALRAFHAYANWLVSISWRRFIVLALLLLIVVGIVHDLPPFTWTVTEHFDAPPKRAATGKEPAIVARVPPALPPPPPTVPKDIPVRIEQGKPGEGVELSIGKDGIRILTKPQAASTAASAADAAASAAEPGIRIVVPPGVIDRQDIRDAIEAARKQIQEDLRAAREAAEEAQRDAEEARRDAQAAIEELVHEQGSGGRSGRRVTRFGIGDFLMQFTILWIAASVIVKFTYKGQKQAEKKAQVATETAEAESLRRQVVEARMAAMQAQVEPHFLFNTLASIDHLIETDASRASQMQKNLIALLRASMPTMREAAGGSGNGVRDLGREIAVIRPYLEILKVRMEERLSTEISVPEGLHSAEFPPMMLQTLVENAIKHGLEPKAEGGHLRVAAEIVHGKLQMTVADTGLGFGKAATAGTGVGLANIRERLQMLYGSRATLTVAENQPSGTVVTITVPYKTVEGNAA